MTKLEITWDGDAPGLPDHRLSLDAFQPALRNLLSAVRRIASDLEMRAREPRKSGPSRGRLAKEASALDIQIESIRSNSPVMISAVVTPMGELTRPLIADLPEMAVDALISSIERESKGHPAHYRVRRFLNSLPEGLTQQRYVHRSLDGTVRGEVSVSSMTVAEERTTPVLIEVTGLLVGFGFEPGRGELKVRASTGELATFNADPSQVERGLNMRLSDVVALGVSENGGRPRLLRLDTLDRKPMPPDVRAKALIKQWDGLLQRLAR